VPVIIRAVRLKTHILVVFTVGICFCLLAATASAATRASTLLAAVNHARAENGLPALRFDPTLARAATAHSVEMLRSDTFTHGAFAERMREFHVAGPFVGENLAWGSGSYAAARAIVAEWLASPEHRANLLRPGFVRIGIGTASGSFLGYARAVVVTADFGGH
jgi:uncharacterized protein YkwD